MNGLSGAFTEELLRTSLHRRLVAKHQNDADTVLIDELGLCQGRARIDLAVVNGLLHGYEIKSEREAFGGWALKLTFTAKFLTESPLSAVNDMSPRRWKLFHGGGKCCESSPPEAPTFRSVRRGRKNPNRDIRALAEFLWLEEAMALLEQRCAPRLATKAASRSLGQSQVRRGSGRGVRASQGHGRDARSS